MFRKPQTFYICSILIQAFLNLLFRHVMLTTYLFCYHLQLYDCIILDFRYRTIDRDAGDFIQDNCCLANTAALELCSHLENKDVIFVSYENKVCKAHACMRAHTDTHTHTYTHTHTHTYTHTKESKQPLHSY